MPTKSIKSLMLVMSGVFIASAIGIQAFSIETNLVNFVQYIQKIVLTDSGGAGGTTGIVLDGKESSIQVNKYCNVDGSICKNINEISNVWVQSGDFLSYTGDNIIMGTGDIDPLLQYTLQIYGRRAGVLLTRTGTNSTSLNLKNGSGRWHISGPRSFDVSNNLAFYYYDSGDISHRIMDITSNGRVGIGTYTPESTLHIVGRTRIDGSLMLNDANNLTGSKRGIYGWDNELQFTLRTGDWGFDDHVMRISTGGDVKVEGYLASQGGQVKRDFLVWSTTTGGTTPIHIKTNINTGTTSVMYKFLIEGYNYYASLPIKSEAVGYCYRTNKVLTHTSTTDYAPGATLSQYVSSDGYVVLKLQTDTYFVGFSVSGWFVNPAGKAFDISAEVFHQAEDL